MVLQCSNVSKNANRMANSVDPDQTALQEQSDLVLHNLLTELSQYFEFYGTF